MRRGEGATGTLPHHHMNERSIPVEEYVIEARTSIIFYPVGSPVYAKDMAVGMAKRIVREAAESSPGYERIDAVRVRNKANDDVIWAQVVPRPEEADIP